MGGTFLRYLCMQENARQPQSFTALGRAKGQARVTVLMESSKAGTRALFRWRVIVGVLYWGMARTTHPVSHALPTCEGGSCSGSVGMGLF